MAFYMNMGSKSQKAQVSPGNGIKMSRGPLAKLECGTPTTPPCDVERQISSSSAPGVKDGVSGTYTTTNFQTDSKIDGKPGTENPPRKIPFSKDPVEKAKQKQWIKDNRKEYEIKIKGNSTPATPTTYDNTKRSEVKFAPDVIPPPPVITPKPKPGPSGSASGRGRKKITIKKPSLSLPLGSGSSKGSGCPGGKKNCGAVNR